MKSTVALLALVWSAAAQQASGQGINFYSLDREIALGRQLAAGMASTLPVVHDPKLEAYVAKVVASLGTPADSRFQYTFTLFDDRKPWWSPSLSLVTPPDGEAGEPVAVAGGAIFVPLSALTKAPNEATFAFQLAHAMAHIAARHATRSATRSELMRIGTEAIPQIQSSTGYTTVALKDSAQLARPLAELTFSRQFEMQADRTATETLAAAGYNPLDVTSYLESLLEPQPQMLAAHPAGSKRAEAVKAAFAQLPQREYATATGDFEAMKAVATAR